MTVLANARINWAVPCHGGPLEERARHLSLPGRRAYRSVKVTRCVAPYPYAPESISIAAVHFRSGCISETKLPRRRGDGCQEVPHLSPWAASPGMMRMLSCNALPAAGSRQLSVPGGNPPTFSRATAATTVLPVRSGGRRRPPWRPVRHLDDNARLGLQHPQGRRLGRHSRSR